MNPEKLRQVDALVGKTISGVILKERDSNAKGQRAQVFLIFRDGTYIEFWSQAEEIRPAGPREGGRSVAEAYCADTMHIVYSTFKRET